MYSIYRRLASNFDIVVAAPAWPGSESFDAQQPFQVIRSPQLPFIHERHGAPLVGMFLSTLKQVLFNPPDQIHCDQVDSAIVGRLLARIARVQYLVYAYAMEITDNNCVALKRWAVAQARVLVVISEYTRAAAFKYWDVPLSRIHLIHPGVDVDRFHPHISPTRVQAKYGLDGKKVILTIGRLAAPERYKGHDSIIRCMPAILSHIPQAVYLIVGDGSDRRRLEAQVKEHGLEGRVIFAGAVPDDELPEFYAACDVFAMPSREGRSKHGGTLTEGFGIVFVEANASGKPVVGGRVGGVPDAIVDGVTGLLVTPDDQDQLTTALVDLLQDQDLAQRLANAGRKRVEQDLQWSFAAKKVSAIVDNLFTTCSNYANPESLSSSEMERS